MAAATVCRGLRTRALAREEQAVRQSIAATVHQWIADVLALPEEHRQEAWTRLVSTMRTAKIQAAELLSDSFNETFATELFMEMASRADMVSQRSERERKQPSSLLRFPRKGPSRSRQRRPA